MDHLLGTLAGAVGVFAGTNVDDLIVLAVLFLSSRAVGTPRVWQISWVPEGSVSRGETPCHIETG